MDSVAWVQTLYTLLLWIDWFRKSVLVYLLGLEQSHCDLLLTERRRAGFKEASTACRMYFLLLLLFIFYCSCLLNVAPTSPLTKPSQYRMETLTQCTINPLRHLLTLVRHFVFLDFGFTQQHRRRRRVDVAERPRCEAPRLHRCGPASFYLLALCFLLWTVVLQAFRKGEKMSS